MTSARNCSWNPPVRRAIRPALRGRPTARRVRRALLGAGIAGAAARAFAPALSAGLTPGLRRELPRRVARLARGLCQGMRARCRFELEPGHPPLSNDPAVTRLVAAAARRVLAPGRVRLLAHPMMTGEDFTYFAAKVPGCYFHVGAGDPRRGLNLPWHHPAFDFDEHGLIAGAAVLAASALAFLAA